MDPLEVFFLVVIILTAPWWIAGLCLIVSALD